MKIVLSGIETNNKGAELMLYAILQEIERRYPDAEVYVPMFAIRQGLSYVKTDLDLKDKKYARLTRLAIKVHMGGILRRLHLPYLFLYDTIPVPGTDYFIDASGFAFSDQWNPDANTVKRWERTLSGYRHVGSRIVFLPQAFGPVSKPWTLQLIKVLDRYADLIMPRESVSYNYLAQCGIDMGKVKKFTDFTSLVKGQFPKRYEHLRNSVCVIPNMRMIDKGVISLDGYLHFLASVVKAARDKGFRVFLLNHEGPEDEKLAYLCKDRSNFSVDVVSGLNALEVKGIIAESYLCISSRFHGVASALNSGVPCLATSWSHKYAELFKDYCIEDGVLNLSDPDSCIKKINGILKQNTNGTIRSELQAILPAIQKETKEMWKMVWNKDN